MSESVALSESAALTVTPSKGRKRKLTSEVDKLGKSPSSLTELTPTGRPARSAAKGVTYSAPTPKKTTPAKKTPAKKEKKAEAKKGKKEEKKPVEIEEKAVEEKEEVKEAEVAKEEKPEEEKPEEEVVDAAIDDAAMDAAVIDDANVEETDEEPALVEENGLSDGEPKADVAQNAEPEEEAEEAAEAVLVEADAADDQLEAATDDNMVDSV